MSPDPDAGLRQRALKAFPPQGISKDSFPAEFKDYHPDTFSQRHKLAVLLHASGLTNNEICEVLGYTPSRVSVILNDPRASAVLEAHAGEVADSLDDVRMRLKLYASEALDEVIDEVRHCEDARIRQRAAFGILDRAGYSKIEKKFVASAQVDPDAAREIADALDERRERKEKYEVPEAEVEKESSDG